ncbi:hypothetical protein CYLTODRAFT_425339 [Cylindrobasidium torrendii FP15055 ss-10]|uniref:F-box domain-containing protein n=1 Tax=Cylindrobasidium torrendii FP15055 ss-10 TaxID=1314674 RepID=A0A0D7B452_9AGAR|nr:hypothetical protein CYLTODRAFT_425339 [Cylindrobasidium torrendii FP15055 ss-10]
MPHLAIASAVNLREILFNSNQVPSEEELQAIDALLIQLRAEQNLPTIQDARLSDIAAMISLLDSVLHPMRYIPDDILALIFMYTTPCSLADGIAEDSIPRLTDHLDSPWTLPQVCRNWRALSLSLPCLWSSFCVPFKDLDNPKRARRIELCIQRSEPLPLRICFDHSACATHLALLPQTTRRWRFLRIECYHGGPAQDNIFVDRLFPRLTHLALDMWCSQTPTTILAPCLRNLEVQCTSIDSGLVVPWLQITQYRSIDTDLEFIARMENLEELVVIEDTFTLHNNYSEVPNPKGTILPNVRRLEHDNTEGVLGSDPHTWLFTRYSFTSLRTLVIIDPNRTYEEDEYPSFAFSLPSVIELSLSFSFADDIRNILLATPNVQSLHIEGKEDPDSLVYCSPSARPSVPCLRQIKHLSFAVGDDQFIGLEFNNVLKMLQDYDLPLEAISFYRSIQDEDENMIPEGEWTTYIQEEMADSLGSWMNDGIRVIYHSTVEHKFA